MTNEYEGWIQPRFPSTFPSSLQSSDSSLNGWGAKAIAGAKPTNSVADASIFLGELLREGIPHIAGVQLWEGRAQLAKSAGKEYLNSEFGWKPLIRDVRNFANAVNHAHKVISQFERDSGKVVRRRFSFPPVLVENTSTYLDNVSPQTGVSTSSMFDSSTSNQGHVIKAHKESIRRWFSGAFTYYLPTGGDARSVMERSALESRRLLGLSLTPDTLWNLAPWSWAIDWFSSTGAVISNLTDWALDGLVLRYGYMMEHTISSDTYTFVGPTGFCSPVQPAEVRLVTETKVRRRASPFGFGLTWDQFSPRQIAIAIALGLSRL
jgi:hypothetical protein